MTGDSANWKYGSGDDLQKANQELLMAGWDTLGWVLFQQGKVEEAQDYVRASWLNKPNAESGLHLGEIEEKMGNPSSALATYRQALSTVPPPAFRQGGLWLSVSFDEVAEKLIERTQTLQKRKMSGQQVQATLSRTQNSAMDLQKLRTFQVGKFSGRNAVIEYSFVLSNGKMSELRQENKLGPDPELPDIDTITKHVDVTKWMPPDSTARLVRAGFLNCHSNVCEFVVNAM